MNLPINIDLPEGFLDEEVRCGYTVTSDMKKVWAVELDLLVQFQKICDKYGLSYFIDGGTLLGAIRHKGFIPWDDDIDITMMRDDYEKFITIARNELYHPYYIQFPGCEKSYFRGHVQLRNGETTGILYDEIKYSLPFNQGIFIDILPLDHLPNEKCKLKIQSIRLKLHNKVICGLMKDHYDSLAKNLAHLCLKIITLPIPTNKLIQHYDNICKKYNRIQTNRVSYITLARGRERNNWKTEWFADTLKVPFEFLVLPGPIGYDLLLKKTYGNYMVFQPNTSSHGEILLDAEKSYIEYLEK